MEGSGWGRGGGVVTGGPILILVCLFFSIPKHVPFKKLNKVGRVSRDEKILKLVMFTFDFVCIFYFYIFITLK